MGIFDLLRGNGKAKSGEKDPADSLSVYSGLRVEVLGEDGALLFSARLSVMTGGKCHLDQLTEDAVSLDEDLPVSMRGFHEESKLAIHLSARITRIQEKLWRGEQLRLTGKDNDRAFFRQGVEASGEVMPVGRVGGKDRSPCEVLNLSAGGVCVRTSAEFDQGDKMILSSQELLGGSTPPLPCEVRRISKRRGLFEYGCRFLNLSSAVEDHIAKTIMKLQMRQMRR